MVTQKYLSACHMPSPALSTDTQRGDSLCLKGGSWSDNKRRRAHHGLSYNVRGACSHSTADRKCRGNTHSNRQILTESHICAGTRPSTGGAGVERTCSPSSARESQSSERDTHQTHLITVVLQRTTAIWKHECFRDRTAATRGPGKVQEYRKDFLKEATFTLRI